MIGSRRITIRKFFCLMVLLVVAFGISFNLPSEARRKASSAKKSSSPHHSGGSSKGRSSRSSRHSSSRHGGRHEVAHHHGKHHRGHHHAHHHVAHKPRYAYPVEMFMMKAPDFDASPLSEDQSYEVSSAFARGVADKYPARTLVRAGVVKQHALRGGIFWRREPIKYIVMHSTETGIPVSGIRVIESWSSMGRRHPGAQYVVDRDGAIYQAVDPDLATVHINILKTLPGINNDNSVGIEMNHTGSQDYPDAQLTSVTRLVTYLQDRYAVPSENIITHRYAQQGDHTDPVHFNWNGFLAGKDRYRNQAIAYKMNNMEKQSGSWGAYSEPAATVESVPSTILQPQTTIIQTKTTGVTLPDTTSGDKTVIFQEVGKPPVVIIDSKPKTNEWGGPLQPPTIMVPSTPAKPAEATQPDAARPETVKPEPKKAPPSRNDAYGLPLLRGPIEVGPEHAGDLTAPKQ